MCVCVKGMALVPSASCLHSGAVSVKVLMHHQESFHFLRQPSPHPQPVPGPGPHVGGRRFFRPPRHPSPQPSLPVLRGLAVLFHTFSTKHLCFFTQVTSTPSRLGMGGWRGIDPAGALLLSHAIRDPLCVSSSGGDLRWGPQWPKPLVPCEICVWQAAGSVGSLHMRAEPPLHLASDFSYETPWPWLLSLKCDLLGCDLEFGGH